MKIFFKRTLHPVGQGAFFTEQFFNEGAEKPFFNVVYDCGSFTDGNLKTPPEILKNAISTVFSTQDTINLLFISHFDGDYINGIQYLINEGYMDKHTIVIIPFKYAKTLSILDDSGNAYNQIALLINELMNRNIHVVGIDDVDLSSEGEGRVVLYENLHTLNKISNGARLVYRNDQGQEMWYYVPFLIKRKHSNFLDRFKVELENRGLTLDDLSDSNIIRNEFDTIREASQHSGKGKAINMHSLQLLSFCANLKKEESSCLYTGDTNLANRFYYDIELDFVNKTLNSIGMMQIPHHGSKKNYPCLISLDDRVGCAFVNYQHNYRQKIFDLSIPTFFTKVGKQLHQITENPNSGYQLSVQIY